MWISLQFKKGSWNQLHNAFHHVVKGPSSGCPVLSHQFTPSSTSFQCASDNVFNNKQESSSSNFYPSTVNVKSWTLINHLKCSATKIHKLRYPILSTLSMHDYTWAAQQLLKIFKGQDDSMINSPLLISKEPSTQGNNSTFLWLIHSPTLHHGYCKSPFSLIFGQTFLSLAVRWLFIKL